MTRFYTFRFVSVCFHLSRPILLSISFIHVQFVPPFLPYPSRSRCFPVPLVSVSFHVHRSRFASHFAFHSSSLVKMQILAGINPRPAGVWIVTRPAGGGGGKGPPPEISQTTGPISKFQTPFDSPVRELPVQGKKFDPEVTDDVTGQVKVRIFDFSGLVTSASKSSMLSANKANESAWIVSLTSVSIISCAL